MSKANKKLWTLRSDPLDIYTTQLEVVGAVPGWHGSVSQVERMDIERMQNSAFHGGATECQATECPGNQLPSNQVPMRPSL